jgi:hypothetical protein
VRDWLVKLLIQLLYWNDNSTFPVLIAGVSKSAEEEYASLSDYHVICKWSLSTQPEHSTSTSSPSSFRLDPLRQYRAITSTSVDMFQTALSVLLQLSLFSLAGAAPITTESHGNDWQYGAGGGVVGFVVLILDIIVFSTYPSHAASPCSIVIVVFMTGTLVLYVSLQNKADVPVTSRSTAIQPSSSEQGLVVLARFLVPYRWNDYLLALLESRCASYWRWIRGHWIELKGLDLV